MKTDNALDELFRQSDVLSLHCPATPETNGVVNRRTLAMMKDGAILLNTARRSLVVEQDVAQALESGKLYACAVDVVDQEPILRSNPLLNAKNCILTPHIAWASTEARTRLMKIIEGQIEEFLRK